jgi:hypothetical protein
MLALQRQVVDKSSVGLPMSTSTMSNANPDFFRTLVADNVGNAYQHRTIIVSTLPELVIGQGDGGETIFHKVPLDTNLTIQALTVTLYGTISIPQGDVLIACKTLHVLAGSLDKDTKVERPGATLDVSTRNEMVLEPFTPKVITEPSTAGTPGAPGDTIAKSIRDGDGKFIVKKDGEQPPYGADGGSGGTITIYCDEIVLDGILLLEANGSDGYAGCNGQDGSPVDAGNADIKAGAGGKGGSGGKGGDGGRILLGYRTVDHPERLISSATPGNSGKPGQAGHVGGDSRRAYGESADPTPPAAAGEVLEQTLDLPTLGTHLDDELLAKLVQRAGSIYLFNQPERYYGEETIFPKVWPVLGALLTWLDGVLNKGNGSARRADLYDTSDNLWDLYKRKKTSFGWDASWVPSTPLNVMLANFDSSMQSRKDVEKAYRNLRVAFADDAAAQLALNDSRTAVKSAAAVHKAKYQEFSGRLGELNVQITAAVTGCTAARTSLEAALNALTEKVKGFFDFSLENLLKAAEMVVFTMGGEPAQGLAMAGVQIAGLVNGGLTKIRDDNGEEVSKGHIVNEIKAVGKSIMDAAGSEMFELDADGQPKITAKHTQLIGEMESFKGDIKRFADRLGDEVAAALDAIDAFETMVKQKGEAVVIYHLLTTRMVTEYTQYIDASREAVALESRTEPLNPTSVATVAYYARLYQAQLASAMEHYAALRRKVSYVTIGKVHDEFAAAASRTWADGNPPDLSTVQAQRVTMADQLTDWAGAQPGSATPFPTKDEPSLLRVVIDEGPLLDNFRETRSITITTVISTTKIPDDNKQGLVPVINSEQFYDIRITHVQPRVIGAFTTDRLLLVKARMTTWSQIYDSSLRACKFSHHYARTGAITHAIDTYVGRKDNRDIHGDGDGKIVDGYLDAVGIFTTWTIWVPETEGTKSVNAGYKLTDDIAIEIHFRGSHRATAK